MLIFFTFSLSMISPLFDPLIWNSVKRYNNFSNLRSVNFYKSAFKTVQKNMVISKQKIHLFSSYLIYLEKDKSLILSFLILFSSIKSILLSPFHPYSVRPYLCGQWKFILLVCWPNKLTCFNIIKSFQLFQHLFQKV